MLGKPEYLALLCCLLASLDWNEESPVLAIKIWVTEKVAAVVGEPAGRLLRFAVVTAGESGQEGREPGGGHKNQGQ